MPGLGRFPCETCDYVANNRRMLARHAVVAHTDKVYKCPLCPFITRYAANWYRHKRDLHGLTKLTTCELCGFFANSTEELAQHKESDHPEHLQLQKYHDKYAREKQQLGADPDDLAEQAVVSNIKFTVASKEKLNYISEIVKDNDVVSSAEVNKEFSVADYTFSQNISENDESVTFSLPLDGVFLENDLNFSQTDSKDVTNFQDTKNMNSLNQSTNNLSPLKVRRSYCCDTCGLLTSNPREFLYHQRDVHNVKMNIHECKYCIYASKHIQKLQRHCNLIHRQQMLEENLLKSKTVKKVKSKSDEKEPNVSPSNLSVFEFPSRDSIPSADYKEFKKKKINPKLLKCAACSYHTRNKFLLIHHEKTMHLKKKFYRCLQCGYVTNEKGRYTKHIKYHSLPKMQCEFCHFKSAYKWNMERHMKNHVMGAEGEYNCTLCTFITHSKQSLKLHVTNHHDHSLDYTTCEEEDGLEDDTIMADFKGPITDVNEPVIEFDWRENNQGENVNFSSTRYDSPDSSNLHSNICENSDFVWKQGKMYQKNLQCHSCDFKAAWPFEMKKHEENHKTQKRHPCPLCGMRFEHIAWLTKHLCRIHKENSQAKNIAAAFELLKPNRRRSGKDISNESVLPIFESALKQVVSNNDKLPVAKQSMLSSLLKKSAPSTYPRTPNKLNASLKQKSKASIKIPFRHQELYAQVSESESVFPISSTKINSGTHACDKCGYKTKWTSEMEKHMRVHSDEKPFQCTRCSYHSKWKGDLTRHMMKYHGIKVPFTAKKFTVPKLKLKKALPSKHRSGSSWQTVRQESVSLFTQPRNLENKEQESPLDLTVCKNTFPHPLHRNMSQKTYDETNEIIDLSKEIPTSHSLKTKVSESKTNSEFSSMSIPVNNNLNSQESTKMSSQAALSVSASVKKKYYCPFCNFNTSTPSRFHVHIVQHYNKRPFMCSLCGYRSNWEWDITKHIRLRGCKDKAHNSACVLLTDETGRRNYDKYDKYLRDVNETVTNREIETINNSSNDIQHSMIQDSHSDISSKNCINNASLVSSAVQEAPISIVVTPDINFTQESFERQDVSTHLTEEYNDLDSTTDMQNLSFKFYLCKHCNYKHSSRKVVISHLATHAGLRPFRCRVCGLTSNWRHVIVRHVKVAHNGYMNDVEDRITYIQEGYVIRLTSVKAVGTTIDTPAVNSTSHFSCKFCPYKCDKEVYIKFHMKQHKPRDGAIYQCVFCPYFVKFKKTLIRHMKLHEPPTPTSSNSTEGNSNVEQWDAANQNYVNGYSYPFPTNSNLCDFSNNQTNYMDNDSIPVTYDQLKSGTSNFTEPIIKLKRHICENCPYRTDNKTQYLYHKQFHRPNSAAPFKCSICSYWATMQHLLTQHMKVHRDDAMESNTGRTFELEVNHSSPAVQHINQNKSNDSDQMSTVFIQRGQLVSKMFKCRFCPMMNKKKANVRIHEKMHSATTSDGKLTCSLCNYKCLNQGGLTNHMKIHQSTEDVQTKQPECDTSSEKNSASSNDNNSSSRKKVFSYFCMRCPAVFKSSSDLYIHKTFHGSTLPFPCPNCDYRAKHKPHLYKHLQVHTPAYVSKRDASFGPKVNSANENLSEFHDSEENVGALPSNKKVDQMLLLEASEVKTFLRKGKDFSRKMHKCLFCPASFFKTMTLAYHISLHGSGGEFGCSQCDYSTTRSANLSIHSQVHTKLCSPSKRLIRTLCCPKCPAVFNKTDRYEKHISLHGKNYRFACDQCDYSVRFAATLFKHKTLHLNTQTLENSITTNNPEIDNVSSVLQNMAMATLPQSAKQQNDNSKQSDSAEEKKTFICDRCPYFQTRKDAVQSHQRRHWQKDGYKCPYCDYSSMGSSFLRDHVKTHIQPTHLFPAQAFMKYEKFEIWCKDEDKKELLFEDKGLDNQLSERFFPTVEQNDLISQNDKILAISNTKADSKRKSSTTNKALAKPIDSLDEVFEEVIKNGTNTDTLHTLQSTSCSVSPNYFPKVVLTDIFSERKELRKLVRSGNLTINKRLKKRGGASNGCNTKRPGACSEFRKRSKSNPGHTNSKYRTQTKNSAEVEADKNTTKSSIIVKIKVENIVEDNNEKSTYVISTKKSKKLYENACDAASDITLPMDNIEDFCPESDHEQPAAVDMSSFNHLQTDDTTKEGTMTNCSGCHKEKHSPVLKAEILGQACNKFPTNELSEDLYRINDVTQCRMDGISEKSQNDISVICESRELSIDFLKQLDTMVNGVTIESDN